MFKMVTKIEVMPILFLVWLILGPTGYCLEKTPPQNGRIEENIFPSGNFSMELEDADIRNVLRALAKESTLNIVVSDEVEGRISVNIHDVSLKNAFLSILRGAGLGYAVEGGIIRVDLLDTIREEKTKILESIQKQREAEQKAREAERKIKEDEKKLIDLITVAVKVNYIINSKATRSIAKELGVKKEVVKDLDGLKKALTKLLTDRKGTSIEVIEANNTLLITDIPDNVEKITKLVKELDVPPQQVLIKARITELNSAYARELGVKWGGIYHTGSSGKSFTSGSYETENGSTANSTSGDISGGKYNISGGAGDNYLVNLPANVAQGVGGAINFGFITNSLNLDIQLSALEDEGLANILASPHVITQDNQRAYIKSGEEIPYQQRTYSGGATFGELEFKDVAIELEVTPHIVKDSVFLDIVVARKEANRTINVKEPPINSRAMTTKVSVKDGTTVVIGGLTREFTANTSNKVPYLAKIPLLGYFFRHKGKEKEKLELLIFITPNILSQPDI